MTPSSGSAPCQTTVCRPRRRGRPSMPTVDIAPPAAPGTVAGTVAHPLRLRGMNDPLAPPPWRRTPHPVAAAGRLLRGPAPSASPPPVSPAPDAPSRRRRSTRDPSLDPGGLGDRRQARRPQAGPARRPSRRRPTPSRPASTAHDRRHRDAGRAASSPARILDSIVVDEGRRHRTPSPCARAAARRTWRASRSPSRTRPRSTSRTSPPARMTISDAAGGRRPDRGHGRLTRRPSAPALAPPNAPATASGAFRHHSATCATIGL